MPGQIPERTDLVIEAELTVRTVRRVQTLLLSAFHDAQAVRLDLRDPIKMDVCGVQLIESARKFALAHGKHLSLKAPVGADVARLLEGLGVLHDSSSEESTFWLHQGAAP